MYFELLLPDDKDRYVKKINTLQLDCCAYILKMIQLSGGPEQNHPAISQPIRSEQKGVWWWQFVMKHNFDKATCEEIMSLQRPVIFEAAMWKSQRNSTWMNEWMN